MFEPGSIITKIENGDCVDTGVKEDFKNELPDILIMVAVITELNQAENCDRRVSLDNLSQQIYHL